MYTLESNTHEICDHINIQLKLLIHFRIHTGIRLNFRHAKSNILLYVYFMRYRERERERVEHFIVLFLMQNKILNLTSVSTAQIVQLQPNDKLWLCSSSGYPLHSITKDTHLNSWLHAISMFSSKESGTRTNRVQRRKIVICVHCALTSRNFTYRNKKKIYKKISTAHPDISGHLVRIISSSHKMK